MAESLSNYRYNHLGGIDADRTLESGEVVPYTLDEDEISSLVHDVEVAPYGQDLGEVKANAIALIDTEAGHARSRHVSNGDLIDEEYKIAEQDAKEWDGVSECPESIAVYAEAEGITNEQSQQLILQTSAYWRVQVQLIRSIRLQAKADVRNCTTVEDVENAVNFAVAQLREIP